MPRSLLDLLWESVRSRPQAEAIIHEDRRVSYARLWGGITRFAERLREHGLQPGDRVALMLDASPEYVAAYYATLAAGGVVVALNTSAREAEISSWLHHCSARVLIGEGRLQLRDAPEHCQRLNLTDLDIWSDTDMPEIQSPCVGSSSELAAIIYTSGTTGSPKGVMLSHANLVSNVLGVIDYLCLTPSDRVIHTLPFYYSYGNSVLHTHLAVGAAVVIESGMAYPRRVLERMVIEQATGFSGVPASYRLLLSRTQLDAYPLESLRYLTQAGGHMSPVDVVRVQSLLPNAEFFIMYGQTEATSRLSYVPPQKLPGKLGSVGIPVAGTEIRIFDDAGVLLPAGVVGNVCARGPGVMLGYWGDPEATQQVLRDGWLWTGDLGYLDEDGFLYLQGRSTDLIKTGAHRVSPLEIEEVLHEIDGVSEVVAAGVDDPLLGQAIKVWLVLQPGARLSVMQVLAHCRQFLPLYKMPKHVAFIDAVPKTASGKVRRNAIRDLDISKQRGLGNGNASEPAIEQGRSGAG